MKDRTPWLDTLKKNVVKKSREAHKSVALAKVALHIRAPATLRVDTFDRRKSYSYNSLSTDVVVEPKVEFRRCRRDDREDELFLESQPLADGV